MKNNKKFAGFWVRHIAFFIDIIIIFIFWSILNILWIGVDDSTIIGYTISLIINLFYFIYFACFHFNFWQTPWKMLVWVKVVSEDFWKISRLQAFWRSFATILSALPFWLWYAWAWWDSKKRTFHDFLAQTVVVEENVISKNWVIFWNVLIFILFALIVFWSISAFYYVIQNPEVLMELNLQNM